MSVLGIPLILANVGGSLCDFGKIPASSITAGTDGYLLKTTAGVCGWSAPSLSNIPGTATNHQFLQSNGAGAAVYNTNVTFPGNFAMTSPTAQALVLELQVYGALKLGGNLAGSAGAVCVSDSLSVPHWEYGAFLCKYYQNTVIDLNGSAAVTLFPAATSDVAAPNSSVTYAAGTFTLVPSGYYRVTVKLQATTVGAGAQTRVNIKINGAFAGSYLSTVVAGTQSIVLTDTYKLLANSTVQIVSQPVVAGTINTSGSDPNGIATSVILIEKIGPYA